MKHNLATASFLFSELPVRSSNRKSSIMWPIIRKSSITWPRLPTKRLTINVISSNFGVNLPKMWAVSMDRCNTGLEFTGRSFKAQSFSWTLIEAQRYLVEIGLRITGRLGFFGEVLSQQPVGVFVGASLPGALRITEEDLHLGGHGEALVFGHLQPSVPGQRAPQGRG